MAGKIYSMFVEWENCIIASTNNHGDVEIGIIELGNFFNIYGDKWKRELVLDDEDVKRVLKGIYFYAHDKKALDFVHGQAQSVK